MITHSDVSTPFDKEYQPNSFDTDSQLKQLNQTDQTQLVLYDPIKNFPPAKHQISNLRTQNLLKLLEIRKGETQDGNLIANFVKKNLEIINSSVQQMIINDKVTIPQISQSQSALFVNQYLDKIKKKSNQSHLRKLINKFSMTGTDASALKQEPERFSSLLQEIAAPSQVSLSVVSKSTDQIQLIKRLKQEKDERLKQIEQRQQYELNKFEEQISQQQKLAEEKQRIDQLDKQKRHSEFIQKIQAKELQRKQEALTSNMRLVKVKSTERLYQKVDKDFQEKQTIELIEQRQKALQKVHSVRNLYAGQIHQVIQQHQSEVNLQRKQVQQRIQQVRQSENEKLKAHIESIKFKPSPVKTLVPLDSSFNKVYKEIKTKSQARQSAEKVTLYLNQVKDLYQPQVSQSKREEIQFRKELLKPKVRQLKPYQDYLQEFKKSKSTKKLPQAELAISNHQHNASLPNLKQLSQNGDKSNQQFDETRTKMNSKNGIDAAIRRSMSSVQSDLTEKVKIGGIMVVDNSPSQGNLLLLEKGIKKKEDLFRKSTGVEKVQALNEINHMYLDLIEAKLSASSPNFQQTVNQQ